MFSIQSWYDMNARTSYCNMYATCLLICLAVITLCVIDTIGDPIQNRIERTHAIYSQTSYLVDHHDKLTLNEVIKHEKLKQAPFDTIPWQFGQQSYWLKITLQNRDVNPISLVSHFDNPMIDRLNVWQLSDENHIIKQQTLGDTINNLTTEQHAFPHFPFTIKGESKTTLIFKIRTNGISKTPINIYEQSYFNALQNSSQLLWGVFIGASVMIALYNLVLYTTIKDPVYLAYISYIISTLILLGSILGFGYYLWPQALQMQFQHFVVTFNFLLSMSALIFAARFLHYHLTPSKLQRAIKYLLIIMAISAMASLFLVEYYAAPLFFINMALLYALFIVLIFNRLLTDFHWAKFYFISWLPLVIGGLIQPLTLLGFIEYSFLTRHAFLIGVMFEVVFMAMALADKVSFEQRKNYFKATHHHSSDLPNHTLLEYRISRLIKEKRRFMVCFIEIKRFAQFLPYLQKKEKQALLNSIVLSLQPMLNNESGLIEIETQVNEQIKLAHLRDGVFGILLSHRINQETLSKLLDKVQATIPDNINLNGLLINLSSRLALCDSIHAQQSCEVMMRRTWQALNKANNDELKVSFYQRSDSHNLSQKLTFAAELQQAIEENALSVRFNPIFTVSGKKLHGISCSLFWIHPQLGSIKQPQIIQIAKQTGLIVPLNQWLIKAIQAQFLKTHQAGLRWYVKLDLNELPHAGYIHTFNGIFEQAPELAKQLTLFTEFDSKQLEKNAYQELLNHLNDSGVTLAYDNFSGDFSSLLQLVENHYRILRLSKVFLEDHPNKQQITLLLSSVLDTARSFDIEVIATAVNSPHLYEIIQECRCHYVQGKVISQRLNSTELALYLRSEPRFSVPHT